MQGIIRAIARLAVMGAVMAAVIVGALVAGLGTTTAIAIGIVLAGVVGLVGVARRPRTKFSGAQEIEAMLAADPLDGSRPKAAAPVARANPSDFMPSLVEATRVESMAPPVTAEVDPEVNMPRWRRPSLLEARRSDPTRYSTTQRTPMRFTHAPAELDVRVVRYAVVPVLDRPDEVLGLRLTDLGTGDEVQVLGATGAFLEVLCPNGDQGFVHRTTLAPRELAAPMPQEADDALNALLSARGLI
ncbi:MAG TPA: hypothetical protein VNL94_05800 [Candidatus Binatia bacterium]|nr:hypothetical protein [Candidatus Binatia bacterium]